MEGSYKNAHKPHNLFRTLREGNIHAFERLYHDNYNRVRIYLIRWHISYEDAEEIAQDVMVAIWEKRGGFRDGNDRQFYRYIYITAKSMAIKRAREKKKEEELHAALRHGSDVFFESPEDKVILNERIESVHNIVSGMPKVRRRIFEMKYNDGLSNEEIARELNITQSTVRSHTQYIQRKLTAKI